MSNFNTFSLKEFQSQPALATKSTQEIKDSLIELVMDGLLCVHEDKNNIMFFPREVAVQKDLDFTRSWLECPYFEVQ